MSQFKDKVIKVVSSIPSGKVMSYGQVALYVGVPRAARQVGWTLNRMGGDSSAASSAGGQAGQVPWWRVVNNQGRISIKGSKYSAVDQKRLLQKEGVKISKDLTFDIEKSRFIPNKKLLASFELDPTYISMISQHIPYSKYFSQK
jgi:methylated-DNA-protein-cysteine methyltransferase-like protein